MTGEHVLRNMIGRDYTSKQLFGFGKKHEEEDEEDENTDTEDWSNPNSLTPQICVNCGERIKLKDIHYYQKNERSPGRYQHKECWDEEFRKKRGR